MRKYFFGIIFALITLTFVFAPLVQAAVPGEGLTISPPISEPNIQPGQSIDQTVILTNPTSKMVEIYPQVMDFKAKGDSGQPAFYNAAESGDKFSLAKWISFNPAKIALTPEQVVNFSYRITVPADAEPGGHYGAMFFLSQPPKDSTAGSKVSIGSMVGSLILVTVPGAITEKGIVQSFSTDTSLYINQTKANIITRISNIGNVHFKPTGLVTVKNVWGQQLSSMNFNDAGGNVLPDSTRKFENNWSPRWYDVGYFKANLNVAYGTTAATLTANTAFWIIPVWFMIAVVLLLILVVGLVVWGIIRFKKKHPKKVKPQNSSQNTPPTNSQPILR